MTDKESKNNNNIVFFWVQNLVGTGSRFSLNLLISLTGGILYSFKIWPSTIALVIFGVVSPLLFTLCLYAILRAINNPIAEIPLPKAFTNLRSNALMMIADMVIIIVLATLIHVDIIDYLLVRLLQTVIFPALMLFMLRLLYINITNPKE